MRTLAVVLALSGMCLWQHASAADLLRLENRAVALGFDATSGVLVLIENKLAGDVYRVVSDEFAVEAVEFHVAFSECTPVAVSLAGSTFTARYDSAFMHGVVAWTLRDQDHFAEKRVTLTSRHDCGLKSVVVSQPVVTANGLDIVAYRYPQFGRPAGTEPLCTYFGRTAHGGFFTGMEMPFDASSLHGRQVTLAYAPSLKLKAGEELLCEPVYCGVYRRHAADDRPPSHAPIRREQAHVEPATAEVLPLPSESEAMVAMTSTILGPPRHGLVPMACGWHCEMEQYTYADENAVEADMKSVDFLAECGIDWMSDCHPWGGETAKMNALGAEDHYAPGELVTKFLEHARQRGVHVVMWPTMNHTHPWSAAGAPFRADKPEWLMTSKTLEGKPDLIVQRTGKANCFANQPFSHWLSRINSEGLQTGYYQSWAMDGSFFGDGGWFTTIIPADCASDQHDHLPGDSNYACQRTLDRLIAGVRRDYPQMYIFMCRPPMDLGVWSLRNVDACFTLLESGTPSSNVAAGDGIRLWSRVRVHHHFFPHYVDQPLLFPSRADRHAPPNWSSEKLDYILLSALSCAPNQLYYLPTKTGIPAQDKAEIHKWLDWGRANIAYLQVRRDLPDWPAATKVDGSAHIVRDQGLVFLFNPSSAALPGEFSLTAESIGLDAEGPFSITQEHPASDTVRSAHSGDTIRWEVPAQTAVVLRIQKTNPCVLQRARPGWSAAVGGPRQDDRRGCRKITGS